MAAPNARWSVDFVHDQFAQGRRFWIFNDEPLSANGPRTMASDDVTKECPAAVVDTSIQGRRVARELTALIARRGQPGLIVSDHGTEFTSNAMLAWSEEKGDGRERPSGRSRLGQQVSPGLEHGKTWTQSRGPIFEKILTRERRALNALDQIRGNRQQMSDSEHQTARQSIE